VKAPQCIIFKPSFIVLVLPRRSKKEEVRQAMGALDIKVICKVGGCKWSKAGTIS
jgi:hypothetical protein